MNRRKTMIGVIGASQPSEEGYALALEVGRLLAEQGAVVVCGGLEGVMEAACRGAWESGGETLGLLPGDAAEQANPFVTLAVPTNLGHARNVLIAQTAAALIAVEGEYGTLCEMAIGLKLGRPVMALRSWTSIPGVVAVQTPKEAVSAVFTWLALKSSPAAG